jgi:uncharacterized protein YndB with AHSA1/START domain
MTEADKPTRTITEAIEIAATPHDVWDAIATGEGARRWFAFDVRVDDRPSGEYVASWGPECEGAWKIESIEPPRRLVLSDSEFIPGMTQTMEFVIEPVAGGRTILRLTHSGIGAEDTWDEMYDSMSRGWSVFFHSARHSIERHPGVDRVVAQARARPSLTRDEVWARLSGPGGLGLSHEPGPGGGSGRFSIAGAEGETWIWNPPKDLAGAVPALNDAVLWISLEMGGGGAVHLDLTLSGFGVPEPDVRAVTDRWQRTLDELFPAG